MLLEDELMGRVRGGKGVSVNLRGHLKRFQG